MSQCWDKTMTCPNIHFATMNRYSSFQGSEQLRNMLSFSSPFSFDSSASTEKCISVSSERPRARWRAAPSRPPPLRRLVSLASQRERE